jgi:predicted metal-dependent peptidase
LLRQQVAHEIDKTQGDVPGHAKRWAEKQLNPKINWKQRLAAQVRNAVQWASGMSDYTYSKMSRRSVCVPRVVLPSLRAPVPTVAVAIDTSGSMSPDDLNSALAETKGILEATGATIEVFAVDAKVHVKQKVFSPADIKLVGGGGTDMGEAIRAAEEMTPPPGILIVLTDGYTPWPSQKPRRVGKVIVCLIGSTRNSWRKPERPPKWCEVIEVEHE